MTAEPPVSGGDSGIPDDVWEKFVRDTEQDIRAQAPKEPSARARMVTERLRREAELAAQQQKKGSRWGRRARAARPVEPAGWRTGTTWHEKERRATRRRWRGALGVLAVVVVLLAVLNPSTALDWLHGDFSGSGASADSADQTGYRSDGSGRPPATLPPETAPPTAAPPADPMADTPTLAEPFRGSPALLYANGEAGIVLPAAKPVGRMTREQVAGALDRTKQFLIDTNLNPATLRGERPQVAMNLIDPWESDVIASWDTAFSKPGKSHNPLTVASRFDPAEVRLVGDVVKTRGLVTFAEGKGGSVAVHADVTFVYGVTAADGRSTAVSRTIVRRVLDFEVADPRVKNVTAGKLWITDYRQDLGNSACDITDGFLHPEIDPADGPGTTPGPSASAVDPYDRSKPVAPAEGCGQVTRV
ncbi:hypothetical protein ABZ721_21185 [Streptomyces sp. NPDC006733]|uniref:hypothetical protein n=1 Tax=Streptomyces sp. NPDC006733 TaxID=3155460 RepID=UPI0033F609B7